MFFSLTQRRLSSSSYLFSLHQLKPSLQFLVHFHTNYKEPIATTIQEDLSNFYTNLLQSHPQIHTIQQTHAQILTNGYSQNSFTATHLIKSYAKFESIKEAQFIFESIKKKKRVFIWNAMIRAFSRIELWSEVVNLFGRMEQEGVEPDHYTLPFVIKGVSVFLYVEQGKRIHELAIELGLVRNVYVATALMEMYIKFGDPDVALRLFEEMPQRDIVAWTSMISGYIENGKNVEALRIFREMRLGDDKPNWVTILILIPACDHSIHSLLVKSGFDSAAEVQIAMLNMYVKLGDVGKAYTLFDQMLEKSIVSWTVMVSGYSQNGYANEALTVFHEMLQTTDLKLDFIIAASVLQACAQLGSLHYGEMIHGYVIRMGSITELEVATSFVDMYAKCGSLTAAQMIFDGMQNRNMITWSALISGYGCHGFGSRALDLFEKMKQEGFIPDETAFLSVLSACSHSGLVCKGKEFFNMMQERYMVKPGIKHYGCMVDLLGRAGWVDEAWDLIEGMPIEPDINIWGTLLSACKIKGNVKIAEYAGRRLLELDCDNLEYHVLLANLYASCGKWKEDSMVRSVIRRKGEKKTPGCSYIEVNCKIHEFLAGDKSHPESEKLNSVLEMLHSLAGNHQ